MTAFVLKIIALATMIIDHTGAVFPHYFGLEFRVIGRVAFPIFVFLLAEGFRHTRSPYMFLVRLGIFAIISEPFFDLALRADLRAVDIISWQFVLENVNFFANANIFYTLFLGGVSICAYDYIRHRMSLFAFFSDDRQSRQKGFLYELFSDYFARQRDWFLLVFAFIMAFAPFFIAEALSTDYASYGVAFILAMYAITNKKIRLAVMAVMCVWQHSWILEFIIFGQADRLDILHIMMIPATLVPVLLAAYYNGRRGPNFKMFFYTAYPAHLAVLFFVAVAI